MKKAIIVLAHQKPKQLNLFFSQLLADVDTDIYVHINKLNESIIPDIMKDSRVIVSKERFAIHWGSDEILQAVISLLKEIKSTKIPYKYIVICTGQDLLVRNGFDTFISSHCNQVFVDCDNRDSEYMNRYVRARVLYKWPLFFRRKYESRYHPFRILRSLYFRYLLNEPDRRKKQVGYDFSKIVFYKDFWQCGLPIEVVDYFLKFTRSYPEYLTAFKNAYMPEEGFFTTFVMNSPYADRIVFHDGFSESLTLRGKEKNDHPVVFTSDDIDYIEGSGCFFARKFDIDVDPEVIYYFCRKVKK